MRCSDDSQNVNPACPSPRKISRMRACRLSYSRASTSVMVTKTASARAFACCLESAESSAERFFVNVATVLLHSRNRPSPNFSEADNYANCETLYAHLREPGCRVRLCDSPTTQHFGDAVVSRLMPMLLPYWFKQLQGMKA